MNRRVRKQSTVKKSDNGYLRYLKPGALAQLRDSKINARSHPRSYDSQISLNRATSTSPASSPSRSPNAAGAIQQQQQEVTGTVTIADGGLPFLSGRFYGPRCPQRKKLMATRSMFSLTADGPEPVIDALSNDFLVAH